MSAATAGVSSVDGGTKASPLKSESGAMIVALLASAHKGHLQLPTPFSMEEERWRLGSI